MGAFLRRLRYLIRGRRMEQELREELEFHRACLQADARSGRTFGNVTLAREDARSVWVWPWLQSVQQDVLYAVRISRRSPAFVAAIVLVTALGIGTTTAVFSLLDALVLRSLPVERPERLVYFDQPSFSYPVFSEVRARSGDLFSGFFAWNLDTLNVEWTTQIEPQEVLTASGDFYSTLGVRAVVGRTFTAADDRIGGGPDGRVALLSHAAWQQRFGGDPAVVGRTIRIEEQPFTIVGVTPPGFFGVAPGLAPEITIPLTTLQTAESLQATTSAWLHLMGRVRDGIPMAQASAAVDSFWPHLLEATIASNMPADRRARYLSRTTSLQSAHAGFSRVRNQFEEPLWILLALVVLLLAVACASATNLLLARGSARAREIAVRLAIGASRRRIARQVLTEALVWTIAGAAAGLLLASWGIEGLVGMMRTREEPIVLSAAMNLRVVAFTIALSMVTAALCALVPVIRAAGIDPHPMLRVARNVGGGSFRGWSAAKVLVVLQVALTVVLLGGAGLFYRSLSRVLSQDAGIDRDRVLVLATSPMAAGYREARLVTYYDELLQRLKGIPGVESASLSWYPPISDDTGHRTQSVGVDGEAVPTDLSQTVYFNAVSPAYFRTVGMRLLRGRDFTDHDSSTSPGVAIVNESLARRLFPRTDAIGHRITIGRDKSRRDLEIVGVVSDAKYQRLQEASRDIAYLPCKQLAEFMAGEDLFAEIRTQSTPSQMREAVRQQAALLDGRVPLVIETVTDRIRTSLVRERVLTILASGLGIAALVLACAGLYGLLAYSISRQTNEIGLRLALGAARQQVLLGVIRQALALALIGMSVGSAVAIVVGRMARSMLFQITPTDPVALASALLTMGTVAMVAAFIPAVRAARVDPIVALRHE